MNMSEFHSLKSRGILGDIPLLFKRLESGGKTKNRKRQMKNNSPLESWEQEEIFIWIRANQIRYPRLQLAYSTLNGVKLGERVRAAAKRQGNRRGVCDVVLPCRSACGQWPGLYLELKRENGGVLSAEQKAFIAGVQAEGYMAVVANGHNAAIATIKAYLGINQQRHQNKQDGPVLHFPV